MGGVRRFIRFVSCDQSPKDELTLESGIKCLHLDSGSKLETKEGVLTDVITLQSL